MPLREPIAHDRPIARAQRLIFAACFLRISAESLLKHRLSALLYIIPKASYWLLMLIKRGMNEQAKLQIEVS